MLMNPHLRRLQIVGAAGLGSLAAVVLWPEGLVLTVQQQIMPLGALLIGMIDQPLEDLIALLMLLLAGLIPIRHWLRCEH
jgi:predicted ATP-dependent Lon-type protease